ncbi:PREDICTED: uncharacterized protein LOC106741671 [Dinoponera quadriceps]|uniref:Uncharacterized protein LOC106741671 n=1 Tax=Dinoponera quadriceps TaxID=609295 RepID=A0A6P3WU58_DINQU|nr:PREDICTED: uncharacterized protein LOC106741671 [Dinoponera quadriceps]XP_014469392.1 PREDICTED: uncharacterized protein LOC106741671 [Dinoponera quadriceps]
MNNEFICSTPNVSKNKKIMSSLIFIDMDSCEEKESSGSQEENEKTQPVQTQDAENEEMLEELEATRFENQMLKQRITENEEALMKLKQRLEAVEKENRGIASLLRNLGTTDIDDIQMRAETCRTQ